MDGIISIEQISYLPNNELKLIRDLNQVLFFGIKTPLNIFSSLQLRVLNINFSSYILMLKCNNNIYRCSISLNDKIQKKLLRKFIKQKNFNLIIFKNNTQEIIKIENIYKKNFKKAFHSPLLLKNNCSITEYSNAQLWNLAY